MNTDMKMQIIANLYRAITADDGGCTLISETHTTLHDAPRRTQDFILGPVWRTCKASNWLHCGKSCLGSNPATGLVLKTSTDPTPRPNSGYDHVQSPTALTCPDLTCRLTLAPASHEP